MRETMVCLPSLAEGKETEARNGTAKYREFFVPFLGILIFFD